MAAASASSAGKAAQLQANERGLTSNKPTASKSTTKSLRAVRMRIDVFKAIIVFDRPNCVEFQ
jgi:hypothetical protein